MTLDADTEFVVRQLMQRRGISFKQALNDAIRAGSRESAAPKEFRTQVRHLGVPTVNLDRALQLVGELEDEEMLRRMRNGQ